VGPFGLFKPRPDDVGEQKPFSFFGADTQKFKEPVLTPRYTFGAPTITKPK